MKLLILFCFTVILSSSCSIQRLAIGQLAPALSSASPKLQEERNWNLFKNATPGSLQLSEVLLEADPGNEDLLALLTKGYAAYGYVVNDTEHYAEKLADVDQCLGQPHDGQLRQVGVQTTSLEDALDYIREISDQYS